MRGLPLVVASGGHSSSRCAGLSLSRPLLLRSTGSRRAGSVVVAHGPSCSVACGIFPDQGSNPCALHWQADSQPLRHQGSPFIGFLHHFTRQRLVKNFLNSIRLYNYCLRGQYSVFFLHILTFILLGFHVYWESFSFLKKYRVRDIVQVYWK